MLKNFMVLICALIILILIGCGRRADETEINLTPEGLIQRVLVIDGNYFTFAREVERARRMFNENLRDRGEYLSINFRLQEGSPNDNFQEALDLRLTRLRVEFMAGMAPDLIFSENFPLYQFAPSGFLADFYTLMDNCDRLSRDDFFVNALKANEFRGGLYELPFVFGFQYIGISDYMPEFIIDSFAQLSYIKVSDFFELYFDFLDTYDEFFHLGHIGSLNLRPIDPFLFNITNYIDFNTNTIDFAPSNLIENVMLANRLELGVNTSTPMGHLHIHYSPSVHIQSVARTHMFYSGLFGLNDADVFINRPFPFSHFIPLANDYGHLVVDFGCRGGGGLSIDASTGSGGRITTVKPLIWMPAARDNSLAWEFVYYLIGAFSEPKGEAMIAINNNLMAPWGHTSFFIPILRSLFEDNMRNTFEYLEYFLYSRRNFQIRENLDIVIQNAIERVYNYTNMPMVRRTPHLPLDLIIEPMQKSLLGIITEQEALSRAENALTLWFMEQ